MKKITAILAIIVVVITVGATASVAKITTEEECMEHCASLYSYPHELTELYACFEDCVNSLD